MIYNTRQSKSELGFKNIDGDFNFKEKRFEYYVKLRKIKTMKLPNFDDIVEFLLSKVDIKKVKFADVIKVSLSVTFCKEDKKSIPQKHQNGDLTYFEDADGLIYNYKNPTKYKREYIVKLLAGTEFNNAGAEFVIDLFLKDLRKCFGDGDFKISIKVTHIEY